MNFEPGLAAVVTGGASGLGNASARALAGAGFKVAIFDINADGGQAKADEIGATFHHVDITDSMRNYVNEKVERLDRHFDQALDIHIVLTVEKLRHKAEATLHVSGNNLHADDVQEDMYAAIDGLIDKLDSLSPECLDLDPAPGGTGRGLRTNTVPEQNPDHTAD